MAEGALDGMGVWLYGEDDERDTFSELLNIGQEATSDAIAADRARLTALEAAGTLGAVSVVGTAGSGWTVVACRGRKKNGIVFLNVTLTRSGSAITVSSTGDVSNTTFASLDSGWAAAGGMQYPATSSAGGRGAHGYVDGSTLWLSSVTPGANIATSDEISLNAVYPLA